MDLFKTRQQIATEYGIDRKTLYRWLKKKEIVIPRGLIKPSNQKIIYEAFGNPNENQSFN